MSRVTSALGVVALLAGACTPPPPVSKPVVPVVAPPAVEEAERGQLCSEVRADGAGSALADQRVRARHSEGRCRLG